MTRKLIDSILTICLLFSSLYLSAHAAEANKTAASISTKKMPDVYFFDGNTCLVKSDIACAKLALANIPSLSPYAKLLQGTIALHEQRIDDALQSLLPLQSESSLTTESKIYLHENLAAVFERINDAPQSAEHLMLAKTIATSSNTPAAEKRTETIHQKIWELLTKQEQDQLVAMRGSNTDNELQGWIDLCLASKNQDLQASITAWSMNYPDHSAITIAKTLAQKTDTAQIKLNLPHSGAIALIMPLINEADAANAEAFKQGLQTSLNIHTIPNTIQLYISNGTPESIAEQHALAKAEGAAYFIAPNFQEQQHNISTVTHDEDKSILHLAPLLHDETRKIANFLSSHAIQRIAIIATDNEAAKQMVASFKYAWQTELGAAPENDQTYLITLPSELQSGDATLLDLKAQLLAHSHDMVLLAMSATDARTVRPYLNISTPTMAFSAAHDILKQNAMEQDASLNAVRFVEIPFLLPNSNETLHAYREASSSLNNNVLLRWFALGADTLQLLLAYQSSDKETIINGLTGALAIDKNGNIQREPSIARFTFNGTELEQ